MRRIFCGWAALAPIALAAASFGHAADVEIVEDDNEIRIDTPHLAAVVRKTGYVSGVAGGSFLDKQTGFRDRGFGLDIVDWIMEPGSDVDHRDKLPDEMIYRFGNDYHGQRPKRSIEGPQICTRAKRIDSKIIRGADFTAVLLSHRYTTAAPGYKAGSLWTQTLVFPHEARWFVSSDRIDSLNSSEAMFLRIDMPGHIKHKGADTFSEAYLSYHGRIPATEFDKNFAPDARFNYRRDAWEAAGKPALERMIRAYHTRDPQTGRDGPWLAGMTLDPAVVHEAWCHERGYVCMIEEFGGRPVRAGESFSAAFVVGWFDSLDDMNKTYDRFRGHRGLAVDGDGWKLTK